MKDLPGFEREMTVASMVAYAGATWDWHRMHYDRDHVTRAGLDGPVVDGQMLGALIAEQILAGLGPRAFITSLQFRLASMVFAGEVVRVEGRVASEDDGTAHTEHRVLVGARLAATGEATVRRRP